MKTSAKLSKIFLILWSLLVLLSHFHIGAISNFRWKEDCNQTLVVEDLKTPAMDVLVWNFNNGKNGLECIRLELGKAEVKGEITGYKVEQLNNGLPNIGLEFMTGKRVILVKSNAKDITYLFCSAKPPTKKWCKFLFGQQATMILPFLWLLVFYIVRVV